MPRDSDDTRLVLEAAVTAFSILGGIMAVLSGFRAAVSIATRKPSQAVGAALERGVGIGFLYGAPLALVAFTMVLTR